MKKTLCFIFAMMIGILICGCNANIGVGQNANLVTEAAQNTDASFATELPASELTERPKELKTCYVLDASNGALAVDALYAKERDTWGKGMFTAENAPQQMTVSFNNESYTGTYEYSVWESGISYAEHCYRTEHTPEGVDFNVDAETGELKYINLMTGSFFERQLTLPELDDPDAETKAIAEEFAGMFVDVDEYDIHRVSTKVYQEDEESEAYTYFTHIFARSVNGIETTDRVMVEVTSKGSLASVFIGDSYVYANAIKKPDDIARIDVERSITEAILDYKLSDGELTGEYCIERAHIALTPNGELAICAAVESGVSFNGAPEGESTSVGIVFIIYI